VDEPQRLFPSVKAVLVSLVLCVTSQGLAARAPITLLTTTPRLSALSKCLLARAGSGGVAVKRDELAEGLEFRLASGTDAEGNRVVTLTALLKPDVSRMIAALDSDAEA
jgi:hypothetical protein